MSNRSGKTSLEWKFGSTAIRVVNRDDIIVEMVQYFLDYAATTGYNFSKRVSYNPKRSINQNFAFGHHEQEKRLR